MKEQASGLFFFFGLRWFETSAPRTTVFSSRGGAALSLNFLAYRDIPLELIEDGRIDAGKTPSHFLDS